MAENKNIPLTLSEKEQELLKTVFKDNEYLLKLMRSLFFGFDLTDKEKGIIQTTFKNVDVREAVRKKIYPILSNEPPIGQIADFWLGTETQIFGASRDTIYQAIQSKLLVKDLFEKGLALLTDPNGERVSLEIGDISTDILQTKLLARNLYLKTIETGLQMIMMTSNVKKEDAEALKKKIAQNSGK